MGPQPLQNSFMQFTTTAVIVIMSVVWLLVVIVIQSLSIVDIHKLSVRIQFQSIVAGNGGGAICTCLLFMSQQAFDHFELVIDPLTNM